MKKILFCGPSFPIEWAQICAPSWKVLPPVTGKSLIQLLEDYPAPGAILMIDGSNEESEGITANQVQGMVENGWKVFGAASFGAWFASSFPHSEIIGIGKIYRWFRLCKITDRSEWVQKYHSENYQPLSLALLDIRSMLNQLIKKNRLPLVEADLLLLEFASMTYPERTWDAFSRRLRHHSIAPADLESLKRVKLEDVFLAIQELNALKDCQADPIAL